jgi:hypothetical protein
MEYEFRALRQPSVIGAIVTDRREHAIEYSFSGYPVNVVEEYTHDRPVWEDA